MGSPYLKKANLTQATGEDQVINNEESKKIEDSQELISFSSEQQCALLFLLQQTTVSSGANIQHLLSSSAAHSGIHSLHNLNVITIWIDYGYRHDRSCVPFQTFFHYPQPHQIHYCEVSEWSLYKH